MTDEVQPEMTAWEVSASTSLAARDLPAWAYKGRAATYKQGHRGILDLDLDFPAAYLRGPALECYVWKLEVADGTRVHAYADVDGRCFHLQWQDVSSQIQHQPTHLEGPCPEADCRVCAAAAHVAKLCSGEGSAA